MMIFSPMTRYELWQSGRSRGQFGGYAHRMRQDQEGDAVKRGLVPIELDIEREYVLVYAWMEGYNAEELCNMGVLTEDDLKQIAFEVMEDLLVKGFLVLDHKPNHVIMRLGKDGKILKRKGKYVYALADFELLERTQAYQEFLVQEKKERGEGGTDF